MELLLAQLLFRHEQALSKGPLAVNPLGIALEASFTRQLEQLGERVLVAAFRPDGFILAKIDGEAGARNINCLPAHGLDVHFDAARLGIEEGQVLEVREIEISIELTIDASEQI